MKIRKTRIVQFTIAALAIATAGYSAYADTIVLDPDGSGNSPKINVNTLEFGAGNSLMQGAIPFTLKQNFQLLFQAQLTSVTDNNGAQFTPIGLNSAGGGASPFEITAVGSVTERVINVNSDNPPRVAYKMASTQANTSFVEIYFDGAQNANPLQGTGYNDGQLILRGVPITSSPNGGIFSLVQPQPATAPSFDLFGNNDYPGITTITGLGATRLDVTVTFLDPAFFVAPAQGDAGRQLKVGDIVSLELSHEIPFDKINPSQKFDGAPNTGTGAGPTPAATPRIGTNNGTGGTDLQAQSFAAASFKPGLNTSPTPTPSTTPTPTATPSGTPTPTPSGTPTPTPSATPSPSGFNVIVQSNKTQVREGNDVLIVFTSKGPLVHSPITVNYSVSGTAVLGTNYTLTGTPGMVVIPNGATTANITLHSINDNKAEPNGLAAKITVAPGNGYLVPGQIDARRITILIVDNNG